jgi:hypothetical protein
MADRGVDYGVWSGYTPATLTMSTLFSIKVDSPYQVECLCEIFSSLSEPVVSMSCLPYWHIFETLL